MLIQLVFFVRDKKSLFEMNIIDDYFYLSGYVITMETDVFHQDLKLCLTSIPDEEVMLTNEESEYGNRNEYDIMNPK